MIQRRLRLLATNKLRVSHVMDAVVILSAAGAGPSVPAPSFIADPLVIEEDAAQTHDPAHEHPVVSPQVSHFKQVPLRTIVKLEQLPQQSPV
jgi:hypothetical protein